MSNHLREFVKTSESICTAIESAGNGRDNMAAVLGGQVTVAVMSLGIYIDARRNQRGFNGPYSPSKPTTPITLAAVGVQVSVLKEIAGRLVSHARKVGSQLELSIGTYGDRASQVHDAAQSCFQTATALETLCNEIGGVVAKRLTRQAA